MRHGEVDYFDEAGRPLRPQTVRLNADGRRQAEAAGRALAAVPLDLAFTSGLERTIETATLALVGRDLPSEAAAWLREIETGRMSEWGAAPAEAVERAILGALGPELSPESRFLGGETFASLQQRLAAGWSALLARTDWRSVLLVAHGVVNRMLLATALGAGLGTLAALEQDASCINLIEVDDAGRCLVRLVNYTPECPLKEGLHLSTLEGLYRQYLRGRD
jgi:probable phosphoglycerate mutase